MACNLYGTISLPCELLPVTHVLDMLNNYIIDGILFQGRTASKKTKVLPLPLPSLVPMIHLVSSTNSPVPSVMASVAHINGAT